MITSGSTYKFILNGVTYTSEATSTINGYVSFTFVPTTLGYNTIEIKDSTNNTISSNLIIFVGISQITSSINLDSSLLNSLIWPVTVSGGTITNNTIVTFDNNFTINTALSYFICGSAHINYEFNYKTVTVNGITNFLGLIKNNSISYSNITINNLNVTILFR